MAAHPKFIIDTNMWLIACASSTDEKNNNSVFDLESRNQIIDVEPLNPIRIRGTIQVLLLKGELVVPEIVISELENKLNSPDFLKKLSDKNKERLTLYVKSINKYYSSRQA
jgi:uncharacterized protein YacL